jgi:spore maturation protein CgeB
MINETILLLIYYYSYEDRNHRVLKHIVSSYCPAYLPFNLYLYEPLEKIFSRVILYDYLKRTAEIGIKGVNKEIIDLVRSEHPKYVIWTSFYYDIQRSTLEAIEKESAIVVGWFFDDEWRFEDYSRWWIPYLDYCVTNAIEAVPKYRALGARVIQTIPNTGIAIERDWSHIDERYEVSFVGSRFYTDREQWISELSKRGIGVHLFGGGWGGYVSFEEMIDIFQSSKINLNFSRAWLNRKPQMKGRIFQVCMAGGFLLTEYVPGIEQYFEVDKEIVCFRNAEEMTDKITYYLNHDEARRAVAQAGWKRATNEYTSFHMVSKVFRQIEQEVASDRKKIAAGTTKLEMPLRVRMLPGSYHFQWGRTLLEENYGGLWKDQLALSISYFPFNLGAWYYYIVGFLPSFMRRALIRVYKAAEAVERSLGWPYAKLVSWLILRNRTAQNGKQTS